MIVVEIMIDIVYGTVISVSLLFTYAKILIHSRYPTHYKRKFFQYLKLKRGQSAFTHFLSFNYG